jgi:K(+)-stimulated pyrophosphate-energized sodium pump
MNMVSLLALPLVIRFNIVSGTENRGTGLWVLLIALAAVAWSWWQSKRESIEMRQMDEEFDRAAQAEIGDLREDREPVAMH